MNFCKFNPMNDAHMREFVGLDKESAVDVLYIDPTSGVVKLGKMYREEVICTKTDEWLYDREVLENPSGVDEGDKLKLGIFVTKVKLRGEWDSP